MTTEEDWRLWVEVRAGNADAFGTLFDRYANAVYNFCFRRTASWSRAEDLVSDVFLEAWRKRAELEFGPNQRLLPWLLAVANNKVRNESRALTRLRSALPRFTSSPTPDFAEDADRRLTDERKMASILDALRELPVGELDVLVLCALGQLEYQEVARVLELPVGTVRSRLARARDRLRAAQETRNYDDGELGTREAVP